MSKKVYLGSLFVVPFLLTSCNGSDTPDQEAVVEYEVYNLSSGGLIGGDVVVSKCNYFVNYNVSNSTMEVKSNNFLYWGANTTFNFPSTSYSIDYIDNFHVLGAQTNHASLSGNYDRKENFAACVISELYQTPLPQIPGFANMNQVTPGFFLTAYIGDGGGNNTIVQSFSSDTYFAGKTTTEFSFQGIPMAYSDNQGGMRIVMDVDNLKASVIMYNIKFAEQAPYLTLVLNDLDLSFSNDSYKITGENIVSQMLESGGLTSYEARPFSKFELTTTMGNLYSIEANFTVQDTKLNVPYKGSFVGSAIKNPAN